MTTEMHEAIQGTQMGLTNKGGLVLSNPDTGKQYRALPDPVSDANWLQADLNKLASASAATLVGAIKAGVTGLACTITPTPNGAKLDFTFTAMPITHTDAAGSGSSGSQEIFDFIEGAWLCVGSRSDLVITADNVLDNGTTLAGVYAFGSVAATAHDGSLSGTEVDWQAASGTLTATAHVLTSATLLKGAGTAKDGTATAAKMFLNESCTAATSVANGTLLVTGTATFNMLFLGDD